ncbi:MAG: type II toxin-antitoxin system VapC family toxin [Chloroflexi bacterium]|nr:MAG: type II toxin-antitoxin system VapC family toxin [Chloroflexota bacterium]
MNPEIVCVDTNVFIRLFTQDDPLQTQSALSLFREAQVGKFQFVVNDLIVAEMAWVLNRSYHLKPYQVRKHLLATINMPFIEVRSADLTMRLTDVLALNVTTNIGYSDAYIAIWMKAHQITTIYTFNRKHFSRVAGLDVRVPQTPIKN